MDVPQLFYCQSNRDFQVLILKIVDNMLVTCKEDVVDQLLKSTGATLMFGEVV